jgi:predicted Zn-dependent peptidase
MYLTYGIPLGDTKLEELVKEIDEEVLKIQTELISEREFEKLQNIYENQFVNSNSSVEGIANSLARYYMLYGDINLINNEIEIYKSITREEIRGIAKKYLNTSQRALLEYLPKKEDTKK